MTQGRVRQLQRYMPGAIALLVYCALAIALTWPLAARLTTDLPGGPHKDGLEDAYQNVWNLWWMREALARPANPLITDRFFYPEHPNLFYHTLSPINTLLAAPITALWGPIAAFNVVGLASLVVGALGARALALDRTGSAEGGLLAGFIYAWSPFHMAALVEDGQLQIIALHWLPFYVLFLLRATERGGRWNVLLAGVFLTLTAWTDWYYTLFLLLFTAAYTAWKLARPHAALAFATKPSASARFALWPPLVGSPGSGRTVLTRIALVGGIFVIGSLPLLAPMLIEATRATYMNLYPPTDPARLSADLLAYVLPARLHPLWGARLWELGVPFDINRRLYLGAVALMLALAGVLHHPAARRWGLLALAFGVLSLGPTLHIGGDSTGIPLPYQLLAPLPLVRLSRQPDRFAVMVMLALAITAAYGARRLLAGRRWPAALALTAAIGALLVLDYLPAPLVTREPTVPAFLAALPKTDDRALLEFPFHDDVPYRDAERMLYQTVHGRPISGGYHSRLYPQPQLNLPVLRDLAAGQRVAEIVTSADDWRADLGTLGFGYIIGYKQQPLGPRNLRPDDIAPFKRQIDQQLGVNGPTYEDDQLIVYEVPAATPRPIVQIRDGWSAVEGVETGKPFRWLGQQGQLGAIVPQAGLYRLSWSARAADMARTLTLTINGQTNTITIAQTDRRYELLLSLPAGMTLLDLRAAEPPTSGSALVGNSDTRPISVRFSQLRLDSIAGDTACGQHCGDPS